MDGLPARSAEDCSKNQKNRQGRSRSGNLREQVVHPEMWPTPTTQEIEHPDAEITATGRRKSKDGKSSHSLNLADQVTIWPTPIASSSQSASMEASKREAERLHPKGQNHLAAEMASRLWETPTAGMGKVDTPNLEYHKRRKSLGKQVGLPGQVQLEEATWPTPTVQDSNKATKKWRDKHQNNLTAAVFNPEQILPTPTSRDWKGGYRTESLIRNDGKSRAMDQLPNAAIGGVGTEKVVGHLYPDWLEWLMGYAPGYTDPEYTETMSLEDHLGFESEPDIPRVTTRKEHRVNRLKCLGNSIVPQIMHEIGKAILIDKEADGVK